MEEVDARVPRSPGNVLFTVAFVVGVVLDESTRNPGADWLRIATSAGAAALVAWFLGQHGYSFGLAGRLAALDHKLMGFLSYSGLVPILWFDASTLLAVGYGATLFALTVARKTTRR